MNEKLQGVSERSPEEKPNRHQRLLADVREFEAQRDRMLDAGADATTNPDLNFLLGRLSYASDELKLEVAANMHLTLDQVVNPTDQ